VGKGLTTQPSGHILIPHVGILEETFGWHVPWMQTFYFNR
jgi:hypothetical protein